MNGPRRDLELARALATLDVPEHRPGFEAELRHRIAREHAARLAARRRARVRWSLRVGVVAAAAAAAAVLLVAIGIPRTDRTPPIGGPEPATAAEIKAKVSAALASLENVSGVVVSDGPRKGDEERWRFALSADGDFRLVGLTERERITYDAAAGVERRIGTSASLGGGPVFYSERRGVAPGPPDLGPPTWILPHAFGAYVRALLAAEDPRVREVEYGGEPAWQLDVDAVPSAIVPDFSGDRFEITVDRETGMPVRVVERRGAAFIREIRIEGLAVNRELGPDAFALRFPRDAEVMESDEGFRRVRLEEVEAAVGYAPLVPAEVPEGYRLAEVAVAREAFPTGAEAGNPRSRLVVSLAYRRGLDGFVVTTRAEGDGEWSDPVATGEGFRDEPERVVLGGGALAGAAAELVIVPRGVPHLWTLEDGLVVTVAGDLGRAELIRVAESLRRGP